MSPSMREATRKKLSIAAYSVIILNLIDAVFTLIYVQNGMATEGNPLMGQALSHSPVGFMAVKLALVSGGVLLLWRLRHRRSAMTGMFTTFAAYLLLFGYHLSAVPQLIASQ
jgi:cytochrome bd-type quinol oxidase subunit 2